MKWDRSLLPSVWFNIADFKIIWNLFSLFPFDLSTCFRTKTKANKFLYFTCGQKNFGTIFGVVIPEN